MSGNPAQDARRMDFRGAADSAPALIWLSDAQDRGLWYNRRWLEYTGRTLQQERGHGWLAGLHPDDRERCVSARAAAFDGRRAFELEYRLKRADGRYGWIADAGSPRFGPDGEFQGYVGCCWDVSGRKQTEQALQENVLHRQAILDNAVDGIIAINGRGAVQSFNPAASRIFGYATEDVLGRNISMLMPEPYRSQHDGYIENYHATGVPRIIGIGREVVGRRKDGSTFPMDLAVSHLAHEGQSMYVGLVRDITERKQMEQMKSEFVSTVSHELRTPLTSISGALGLVAGGALGELPTQARQMIDIAYKNSLRLSHLINDLLDIEKLAAGKMRLDLQVQPLMPLVEQALEANRVFAEQHQVWFELIERDDAVMVRVDSIRLQQILANFLSNAAKFSPAGARIEIAVSSREGRARVDVIDHGPGVPEAFRKRIFQKFSQADSSDTRSKGGTGLGLAISKELAERMNGGVGFASQEGEGACFFLELPTIETDAAATAGPALNSSAPRLLVVEDEPDIARLLEMMLRRGGYRVDIAPDGKTALARLAQNTYDAMTLDLMLPDHLGVDLIRRIRNTPETATLPIIVISAHTEGGKLSIDGDLTAMDWLDKPIDEARLTASIRRTLSKPGHSRPRVLHVEDDADLQRIVAAIGRELADFDTVHTLAEARASLARTPYSLVILDISLPDGSGWELLPHIKALDPEPPVIVLSAEELTAARKAAVQAALVKTHSTNRDLLVSLKRQLAGHADPETA